MAKLRKDLHEQGYHLDVVKGGFLHTTIDVGDTEFEAWQPDALDDSEYNVIIVLNDIVYRCKSIDLEFD